MELNVNRDMWGKPCIIKKKHPPEAIKIITVHKSKFAVVAAFFFRRGCASKKFVKLPLLSVSFMNNYYLRNEISIAVNVIRADKEERRKIRRVTALYLKIASLM